MAEAERQPWTVVEFLDWEGAQPERYELANGQPVMITGGNQAHSLITVNIAAELKSRLRGTPCRPGSADLRVLIPSGNVRYPDITVDCGEFRPDSNNASEPRVVFEVLSKSTAWVDLHDKLRDYERTPTIQHYVIVTQNAAKVVVWTRTPHGHLVPGDDITGLAAEITLSALGLSLPLSALYDGLPP